MSMSHILNANIPSLTAISGMLPIICLKSTTSTSENLVLLNLRKQKML